MTQQSNREGQQFGNYRLERLLGRGGFAEIYLGYHLHLQRPAAIKILHAHLSEQEISAFQQEAQLIAALNHPNIVRIFDFDVQAGIPFLVMDYLPHGTLRQRHYKGEQVPLTTVNLYVKQVAEALQYAHTRRLIHRDVKPANMLIGPDYEVVLSDFGIAAIAHESTSKIAQESAGTLPYMAPEQIQAHALAASDQYALGIVVYEWLSGERPFNGSFSEIFAKHLMAQPPSLLQKLPTLPAEVELVVFKALAKDARDRFSSIRAFAVALQEASLSATPEQASYATLHEVSAATASYAATFPTKNQADEVANAIIPAQSSEPQPSAVAPLILTEPPAPWNTEVLKNTALPAPPSLPTPITPPTTLPPVSPQKSMINDKFSRRTAAIFLITGGIIAATGASTWWLLTPHPSSYSKSPSHHVLIASASATGTVFVYQGHSDSVHALAWSPDSKRIVSASVDRTVQVWNAADGSRVFLYHGHAGVVRAVAWSPDGKYIASSVTVVQVWNALNGSNVFSYHGHSGMVRAVAWSPDSMRITSAGVDGTVQVWNVVDGSNLFSYQGHARGVNAVAWLSDGKRIASASVDGTVQVWNAADGGDVFTYQGHARGVNAVAWLSDGKRIASAGVDGTVQIWNAADGGDVFIYQGHARGVNAVACSPDGKRIASAGVDGTVQVWNVANGGDVFTYNGHSGNILSAVWSPDGRHIASASSDETVQVWEAR